MIVKYSKKFPYAPYLNEDIGFEMELDDGTGTGPIDPERLMSALSFLKGVAERFHKENNPEFVATDFNTGEQFPQVIEEKQIDRRIGVLAEDILSSPDLKTLESYKLIVKAKPELQTAYDQRLKELS